MKTILITFCAVINILFFIACNQDEQGEVAIQNLNSFKMILNDESWEPSTIDHCIKTFSCNFSKIDNRPFYTIQAFQDPQMTADFSSKNFLRLQVMGVDTAGVYPIAEKYGDFNNYIRFTINDENGQKVYQNSITEGSFFVEIKEFYSREASEIIGIRGAFSGTIYNINNAIDSLEIKNAAFTFKKANWNNFNHCEE